jgi:hypothetical protein
MFASKDSAYLNEAPFRFSTLVWASGHIQKRFTKLKRPAGYKYYSLFKTFTHYVVKSFIILVKLDSNLFFFITGIKKKIESVSFNFFRPSLLFVGQISSLFKY